VKIIGPIEPPGVVHEVLLKDGTIVDAFMCMGRRDLPDGSWLTHDVVSVDVTDMIAEVQGRRMRERKSTEGLLKP
jgi:hypothetical protein